MSSIYACSHPGCGKTYVNNSILKRHVQAFHNAEKRFQCSSCGKCLASRQNLKEHSYTHTGEKPYKCSVPECGASFRQGTHLSAHKRNEHSSLIDNIDSFLPVNYKIDLSLLTRLIGKISLQDEKQICEPNEKILLKPIKEPYCCRVPSVFQDI